MGEYEGRPRDLADLAGADGDVLEGAPPPGEQGEAALAQAAQGPQQHVAGAGVDVQLRAVGGLFDRGVYPDPGAFVAGVGEGGQSSGGGGVERAEDVRAGRGQTVCEFGLGPRSHVIVGCRQERPGR